MSPATILRTAFLLSLVGAATLALGCEAAAWGNGDAASEPRELPAFTAIDVSAGIDVELEVAGGGGAPQRTRVGGQTATLRCDANLLHRIDTFVADGTLHVTTDEHVDLRPRTPCELVVATDRLVSIAIEGPTGMVVHGALTELRDVQLEGPVELDADGIAVAALDVRAEGPVELALAGAAFAVAFDLEGPVELDAGGLAAQTVELLAVGPVQADVRANDRLVLDLEGPVEVDVHGNPRHRDVETEGPVEVHYR